MSVLVHLYQSTLFLKNLAHFPVHPLCFYLSLKYSPIFLYSAILFTSKLYHIESLHAEVVDYCQICINIFIMF